MTFAQSLRQRELFWSGTPVYFGLRLAYLCTEGEEQFGREYAMREGCSAAMACAAFGMRKPG